MLYSMINEVLSLKIVLLDLSIAKVMYASAAGEMLRTREGRISKVNEFYMI